jgi:hypothetical protein
MRGKLRDKRDVKRDRLKREMMGRRPAKRDNRHLPLLQRTEDDDDDYLLDEEEEFIVEEEQQN